ncbi:hypothetical protein llap_11990 [Limosa lapponica baueri]|uniref:Uncharacterized protein n=1 Tax=Limosa lapponica baueri TaxID=1758121 RepID=A0A2I0TV64_LIMLA|nr:hypothetical protein llap_11990 [Limosa lapponica baueri]
MGSLPQDTVLQELFQHLTPLKDILVYLNLSFNNLLFFPIEATVDISLLLVSTSTAHDSTHTVMLPDTVVDPWFHGFAPVQAQGYVYILGQITVVDAGVKVCSSSKVTQPTAQLKCLYANACSMGNKQEELEATVLLERNDVVAIAETWWDESQDWSAAVDSYRQIGIITIIIKCSTASLSGFQVRPGSWQASMEEVVSVSSCLNRDTFKEQ